MAGSYEAIPRLQRLLRQQPGLSATVFAALLREYGYEWATDPWLSRSLKKGRVESDREIAVREVLQKVENFLKAIDRLLVIPVFVSFGDVEKIDMMRFSIDLVNDGMEYVAAAVINSSKKLDNSSANIVPMAETSKSNFGEADDGTVS